MLYHAFSNAEPLAASTKEKKIAANIQELVSYDKDD
jgi:hypothetical protein